LQDADGFSTAHLIVEHGLQNTAVISFLRSRFPELTPSQQRVLLNASYNNLIDWHINIDSEGVTYVYNRWGPPSFHTKRNQLTRANIGMLTSQNFEVIAAEHPSPDVLALDDALIKTISVWKRHIGSEIPGISNTSLSALFNAIIFVRAAEDHARRKSFGTSVSFQRQRVLLGVAMEQAGNVPIRTVLAQALGGLGIADPPKWLLEWDALRTFDRLSPESSRDLLSDFYRNRYQKYFEYDFSLMSKHALSRIYEHYVSSLRQPASIQGTLFLPLAEERLERSFGNVYTPEFIARFFARFLKKQLPLTSFQRLAVTDPACGSGIFLRTIIEAQQESLFLESTSETLRTLFQRVCGIDIDPNACQATRLSLALLALVLIDELPEQLRIVNNETLKYYIDNPTLRSSADVVVANPPFVRLEDLAADVRPRVEEVLADVSGGRVDLYLAVLKISIEMLKAGGYGLFVLPQNFLVSENAAGMRAFLSSQASIHCIVDLSDIQVFEDVSAYVILIIFQKKPHGNISSPPLFARCSDLVGYTLQDVLDGRISDSQFYSVFELEGSALEGEKWEILSPLSCSVRKKLSRVSTLGELAELRQGIVTGADDTFIVPTRDIPKGEEEVYIPLLGDREMEVFTVPASPLMSVFYPYVGTRVIDEATLEVRFPKTYQYLSSKRALLEARTAVTTKGVPWWRPSWPREPKNLLRPKIVTPHVVIAPRFALDLSGGYGVSHSPIILAKPSQTAEKDHLKFLLAVLNSSTCFWDITQKSHKYRGGYARLEVSTLKSIAVPDPSTVDRVRLRHILRLVSHRLEVCGAAAFSIEQELDIEVANLYGLSAQERKIVGVSDGL
jgi:tRNA1(Val) A37 N6-methylase TrmN6